MNKDVYIRDPVLVELLLNFYTRLRRCRRKFHLRRYILLRRHTNRPFGHRSRNTKRLTVLTSTARLRPTDRRLTLFLDCHVPPTSVHLSSADVLH